MQCVSRNRLALPSRCQHYDSHKADASNAAADLQTSQQVQVGLALLQSAMMEAENLPEGRDFDDVTNLLYALEQLRSKWRGSAGDMPTLSHCLAQLQGWLCVSVSATKPGKLLELLHTLSMSRGATESCSLELLTLLASELLAQSQVLGGAGLALALQAFGRLRVLERRGGHVDGGAESQEGKLPRLPGGSKQRAAGRYPKQPQNP
eukprot:s672_g8.t1